MNLILLEDGLEDVVGVFNNIPDLVVGVLKAVEDEICEDIDSWMEEVKYPLDVEITYKEIGKSYARISVEYKEHNDDKIFSTHLFYLTLMELNNYTYKYIEEV